MENFGGTKDYLGIVFPIAISAVGSSLMALVSAKTAGEILYPCKSTTCAPRDNVEWS